MWISFQLLQVPNKDQVVQYENMAIIVTTATVEDIDTFWRWGEENWELWSTKEQRWYSKESLRLWIENPEDDILLVAKDGKKSVGIFFLNVLRDWALSTAMYVELPYRRRGIGKMLVKEAIKVLSAKGVYTIDLLVDLENKTGIKFWKKLGFKGDMKFQWMNLSIDSKI